MKSRFRKIAISEIPSHILYEGYLWLSDQSKPIVYKNETPDFSLLSSLPFVVEGNLWANDQELSIQIKCIDGIYQIIEFDLSNADEDPLLDVVSYVAHDVGYPFYSVVEAWEEKEDEFSQMTVLTPTWTAFRGFSNKKL